MNRVLKLSMLHVVYSENNQNKKKKTTKKFDLNFVNLLLVTAWSYFLCTVGLSKQAHTEVVGSQYSHYGRRKTEIWY